MKRIKVMTVFGTRPEAIKMAPVVLELNKYPEYITPVVAVTAQHREMLDQVLNLFEIKPDHDLNIMAQGQTLFDITTKAMQGLNEVLSTEKPDIVLVHGDTTTTFAGALTAFYHQIAVGHVEAGLRTHDKYSPYPEEMNRKLTGSLADLHFAPTVTSSHNLCQENIDEKAVFITGNTVIDALLATVDENYQFENELLKNIDYKNKKIVLVTTHRRENLGEPMRHVYQALRCLVEEFPEVEVIAGTATAGIPHGAIIADKMNLPFAYIRSKPKDHGAGNQIEGRVVKGEKMVVVEDLISTGGSVLDAVAAAEREGADVIGVVAIFTYELPKAEKNFADAGVKLVTLSNYTELIKVAKVQGYITADGLQLLKKFKENQETWQN